MSLLEDEFSALFETQEDTMFVVDYSRTLQEMISEGNYDLIHDAIQEINSPISLEMTGKKVETYGKLFHFNREISSEDAISKMDEVNYRPATLEELLALGEAQPELQRQFPIIALGSVWRRGPLGIPFVPCLDVDSGWRELDLRCFNDDWGTHSCFLAVYE